MWRNAAAFSKSDWYYDSMKWTGKVFGGVFGLMLGGPFGAALGAGVGGVLGSRLFARFGARWGFRLIPLCAMPAAGLALIIAVEAANPYWAVAALTVAFAGVELIEGPVWAATMYIARADTMAATGLLNTGGNLGGLISIPLVAYLSGNHEWTAAFVLASVFALLSGLIWMWIDATDSGCIQQPHQPEAPSGVA